MLGGGRPRDDWKLCDWRVSVVKQNKQNGGRTGPATTKLLFSPVSYVDTALRLQHFTTNDDLLIRSLNDVVNM